MALARVLYCCAVAWVVGDVAQESSASGGLCTVAVDEVGLLQSRQVQEGYHRRGKSYQHQPYGDHGHRPYHHPYGSHKHQGYKHYGHDYPSPSPPYHPPSPPYHPPSPPTPDGLEKLVFHLNEMYRKGKPSNDASEAGVVMRTGVPVNWYYIPPKYTTPPQKTSESVTALNYNVSTPDKEGCDIAAFPTWSIDSGGIHAPVGVIYSPCAVDAATECSYPLSARTNSRLGKYRCARYNATKWIANPGGSETAVIPGGIPDDATLAKIIYGLSVDPNCQYCFVDNNVLPSNKNIANGLTVYAIDEPLENPPYFQNVTYPEMADTPPNLTTAEMELLYNRENEIVSGQFWPRCQQCFKDNFNSTDEALDGTLLAAMFMFFEGKGFYGRMPGYAQASSQPANQLKDMMEAQAQYFAGNSVPCKPPTNNFGDDDRGVYNELALNTDIINELETKRSFHTDFDGRDKSGVCRAGITALVKFCGKETNINYCTDISDWYKKQDYHNKQTPPVIWMDLQNYTHPFSTTCDKPDPCPPCPQAD